jgi:hypothetical protein
VREMRTIPTILAAAAIAVTPVVFSAPSAHAGDKCDQYAATPAAYDMCESQQARLNHDPPHQLSLPSTYHGWADANGSCWSSAGTLLNPICKPPCNMVWYTGIGSEIPEPNPNLRTGEWCSDTAQ